MIEKAENLLRDPEYTYQRSLQSVMSALAFHKGVIVREWIGLAKHCDWNLDSESLREYTFQLFGSKQETKTLCEDAICHLRECERADNNVSMSDYRKYCELQCYAARSQREKPRASLTKPPIRFTSHRPCNNLVVCCSVEAVQGKAA